MREQVTEERVPAEREHDPSQCHEMPDKPLGRPLTQSEAAKKRDRPDDREYPDVVRYLGQVVGRKERWLAEGA